MNCRLESWLIKVDRVDLLQKGPTYCYENRRICNKHFEVQMFTDGFKNKLKRNAMPMSITREINTFEPCGRSTPLISDNGINSNKCIQLYMYK